MQQLKYRDCNLMYLCAVNGTLVFAKSSS